MRISELEAELAQMRARDGDREVVSFFFGTRLERPLTGCGEKIEWGDPQLCQVTSITYEVPS